MSVCSQTLKLINLQRIRGRVSVLSTVHDPTGLEIIIPQASQSSPDFMSSILDSHVGSGEDSWISEDSEEERTTEQRDGDTGNIQLISAVRFMQLH